MWKWYTVLCLLISPPALNCDETPPPRRCAVCLDKDCANGVRMIYPASSDTPVWPKANSSTGIQNCAMENLKADAPCKMANGILVQLADNPLHFEGKDSSGVWCIFNSQISPCADLNLPPKPSPGMCAVCLEKDCTTGVREIYPAGSITTVWVKANSPTGIQNCSMENLKPDAPCKMANGSLVLQVDNPLRFDGSNPYGARCEFKSQISPCADLNLLSTPSPVIQAPIRTPAAPNDPVADKKDRFRGIVGIIIIILIGISIGFFIGKCNSRGQGQDGDHRHGNNGVPPHDAEDRDENTIEKQPLKGEDANGNINGVH